VDLTAQFDPPQAGGLYGWHRSPEQPKLRTDIPHGARVYDYLLGGKDNFAADRDAAKWSLKRVPQMLDIARGNRRFMIRAIRFLCDADIRQFLDIGAGLPTSPNTHEVAQATDPAARVVYVDNGSGTHLGMATTRLTLLCADLP
jgi:hypothetical protein